MMTNAYWQSIPTLAAQTAQYLSQGADKMYLYNLFNDIKEKFLVCASLENALAAAKRSYVINYSNTTPYGVDGIDEYIPLPISVTANERSDGVLIEHGTLDYNKDSVIYVAVVGVHSSDVTADTLSVYYNGIKCTYRGTSTKSYLGTSTTYGLVFEFVVPKADIDGSESGYVRFTSNTDLTVNYVELMNGNSRV